MHATLVGLKGWLWGITACLCVLYIYICGLKGDFGSFLLSITGAILCILRFEYKIEIFLFLCVCFRFIVHKPRKVVG